MWATILRIACFQVVAVTISSFGTSAVGSHVVNLIFVAWWSWCGDVGDFIFATATPTATSRASSRFIWINDIHLFTLKGWFQLLCDNIQVWYLLWHCATNLVWFTPRVSETKSQYSLVCKGPVPKNFFFFRSYLFITHNWEGCPIWPPGGFLYWPATSLF